MQPQLAGHKLKSGAHCRPYKKRHASAERCHLLRRRTKDGTAKILPTNLELRREAPPFFPSGALVHSNALSEGAGREANRRAARGRPYMAHFTAGVRVRR